MRSFQRGLRDNRPRTTFAATTAETPLGSRAGASSTTSAATMLSEVKVKNGDRIKFEETPYYFKITIGKRTWYWVRETGEYDGTSFKVAED